MAAPAGRGRRQVSLRDPDSPLGLGAFAVHRGTPALIPTRIRSPRHRSTSVTGTGPPPGGSCRFVPMPKASRPRRAATSGGLPVRRWRGSPNISKIGASSQRPRPGPGDGV